MAMNKGITTIEMMVTIGIMAIMASAIFFSWQPAGSSFALTRSTHQLASDLRRAQQMSISTHVFSCASQDPEFSGYGVFLDTSDRTGYYLFENCTANWLYSSGEDIEWQDFEEGVRIKSISVVGTYGSSNQANVVFVPPNPKVYIQGYSSDHEAVITLELIDGSLERQVKINNAGRIEIN